MLSAVRPTFFNVVVKVELLLTFTLPKLNEAGVNWGSGSITLAVTGTGSVKPWLTNFSVAVETPSCDTLVTFGAVKVTVTVQDRPAPRVLGHLVEKEKLFALAPEPGVREMLSGTAILPWLLMVTTVETE